MAGNQSRGLIAASKTKGWDPTVIPGFGSIANFDKDQGNLAGKHVGTLPGGTPDGWPDGNDVSLGGGVTEATFAHPDTSREKPQHTTNANPFPAMPGAE